MQNFWKEAVAVGIKFEGTDSVVDGMWQELLCCYKNRLQNWKRYAEIFFDATQPLNFTKNRYATTFFKITTQPLFFTQPVLSKTLLNHFSWTTIVA